MARNRHPRRDPLPGHRRDLVADAHPAAQRTHRRRSRGVLPWFDRELACAVVLRCVHDMTENRISARRRTARWDPDADVSVREAMDFWSFAAAAANVVMQLAVPGVGYGVVE